MIISIVSWALRVIGFFMFVAALVMAIGYGFSTFRAVAYAVYTLTLVTLLFGSCGKSLSKKPTMFLTCACPLILILGGFAGLGFLAKTRSLEIADKKIANDKSLSEWFQEDGNKVFATLYERGECKGFKCDSKLTSVLFSAQYLEETDDRISEKCRAIYKAVTGSDVLSTISSFVSLGVFKRLEKLVNTEVPAGQEKDFVWCHIERGFFKSLANLWTGLFWAALFVAAGITLQSIVACCKKAINRSK